MEQAVRKRKCHYKNILDSDSGKIYNFSGKADQDLIFLKKSCKILTLFKGPI
jgi:hypothetical protein